MNLKRIRTTEDLSSLISVKAEELTAIIPAEHYRVFQIPKPGTNEKRTIETPTGRLKEILERLADPFQWYYCDHKTDAAYGYIRHLANSKDKRNILTNASRHTGNDYLLNIDIDSFFHQIDTPMLRKLFNDHTLFTFDTATEDLLCELVSYRGRLPMGSPVSPALSNFATIRLDEELLHWCRRNQICYTRYVDDLSFSSGQAITDRNYHDIRDIMLSHKFKPDEAKTKWYGKNDIKEITGLVVGKKVGIPEGFISDFEKSIEKLKQVYLTLSIMPDHHVYDWLDKMRSALEGRLNFIGSIYGKKHSLYLRLRNMLNEAGQTNPDEAESISWRYIGYEIH